MRWILVGVWTMHAAMALASDDSVPSVAQHMASVHVARAAAGPHIAGRLNPEELALRQRYEKEYGGGSGSPWVMGLMMGLLHWDHADLSKKYLSFACQMNADIAPQLLKAGREAVRTEPSIALAYARGIQLADPQGYEALVSEVIARHPDELATMEAMFLQAQDTENAAGRVQILERIRKRFSRFAVHAAAVDPKDDTHADGPYRYNWMMRALFSEYQKTDVGLAAGLAREMSKANPADAAWSVTVLLQDILAGMRQEWQPVVEQAFLRSHSVAAQFEEQTQMQIKLLRADLALSFDDYRRFCEEVARTPVEPLVSALRRMGSRLEKSPQQVSADLSAAQRRLAGVNGEFKDFALSDFSGETIRLSDLRGKVVLVNFWFPSCLPCVAEFPFFQQLVDRYRGREDFVLLAINISPLQDNEVLPLFEGRALSFTPLKVPDEGWAERTYGVTGAPRSFLLDTDGRAVYEPPTLQNADDLKVLAQQVDQLLLQR